MNRDEYTYGSQGQGGSFRNFSDREDQWQRGPWSGQSGYYGPQSGYGQGSYGQGGYSQGGYGQGYQSGQQWSPGQSGYPGFQGGYGQGGFGSGFQGGHGQGGYGQGTFGQGTYGQGTYGQGSYGQGYGQGYQSGQQWSPGQSSYQGFQGGFGSQGRESWQGREFGRGYGYEGQSTLSEGQGTWQQRGRFMGRGPKGYKRGDERIREDINEELTRHPDIDAYEIEVRVENGEVTLTGTVEDRHAKRLAEDLAERTSGVTDVHNQLRVRQGLREKISSLVGGEGSEEQRSQKSSEREGGETRSRSGRSTT